METSETITFISNKNEKQKPAEIEPQSDKKTKTPSICCKFIICVSFIAAIIVSTLFVLYIYNSTPQTDIKPEHQKLINPEIWQVIIGNESCTNTEIRANILVIPTELSKTQLILMHEMEIETKPINHSFSYNFTIIPDTIIELNENYTINKMLTNKNETKNVVLYAFAYFYQNCFVGCTEDTECGIAVDQHYLMYCVTYDKLPQINEDYNDSIVMKIILMNNAAINESVINDVGNNLMHQLLSNYSKPTESNRNSVFSEYFDHNIYYEHDWHNFAWSTDDNKQDVLETTSPATPADHDRRILQSGTVTDILNNLPQGFETDVLNAISNLFDDTLWIETCGFLLDGCDYYQSQVAADSFSEWWAGKYSYGIDNLCVEFKALPYIKAGTNKNPGSAQGSVELEVGLNKYDQNTPAIEASFNAYVSQKLCVGLIFWEWCYRDVTDRADISFEVTPSFALEINYDISLDISQNYSAFILKYGLNEIIALLSECDFNYDLDNDRALTDYFSYLIPFANILSFIYDNIVDFLLDLMDKNICPLLQLYAQQYMTDMISNLLNNNNQYLTLLNVQNPNIAINNGFIYLYHNIWLDTYYNYSLDFQISDVCTEILMDCVSDVTLMNAVFSAHIPNDRGSNNAYIAWNTDCNRYINDIPKAIVGLWDDDDGFADIDYMKCGAYLDMLTCEYNDHTWIDLNDCYTLNKNDGGSSNPYVQWDTECNNNYLMTAMYDTDDGFNDVNNWKCCSLNIQQYFIDYNDCEAIAMNGNTDGGSTEATVKWRAQCSYGYFVVGMYDDDDNFSDIDAMKCCAVKKV